MSDRHIEDDDVSVDEAKQSAITKHLNDIYVMDKLVFALNEYIIKFGRTSNVHDECFDLKAQIIENKKHLQEWVDKI